MSGARVLRITFSRSLAELIAKEFGYIVRRVTIHLGEENPTNSVLYAVCKTNGWPLRVTFFREMAEMWKTDFTRVFACTIKLI